MAVACVFSKQRSAVFAALNPLKCCLYKCYGDAVSGLARQSLGIGLHRPFRFGTNHSHAAKSPKRKEDSLIENPFHHSQHLSLKDLSFMKPLVFSPWGNRGGEVRISYNPYDKGAEGSVMSLGSFEQSLKQTILSATTLKCLYSWVWETNTPPSLILLPPPPPAPFCCSSTGYAELTVDDGSGPWREWNLMSAMKSPSDLREGLLFLMCPLSIRTS